MECGAILRRAATRLICQTERLWVVLMKADYLRVSWESEANIPSLVRGRVFFENPGLILICLVRFFARTSRLCLVKNWAEISRSTINWLRIPFRIRESMKQLFVEISRDCSTVGNKKPVFEKDSLITSCSDLLSIKVNTLRRFLAVTGSSTGLQRQSNENHTEWGGLQETATSWQVPRFVRPCILFPEIFHVDKIRRRSQKMSNQTNT